MKAHPYPCPVLLLALAGLSCVRPLAAQESTDHSSPATDVVELSPFTIKTDKDNGYQASDTLVGGRIATSLDHTPAAVSVLTREFLDDIGASNFNAAAAWSTNAVLQNPNSTFSEFQVNMRGVGAGLQTINYFTFQNQSDGYNIERIEFARGPNSLLFGQGTLSGIPTTFTKQPKFRNFDDATLRIDSFGGKRATADLNHVSSDGRIAVRVNLMGERGDSWRDNSFYDRTGVDVAAAVRITKTTLFRVEVEHGALVRPLGDSNFTDGYSNYDRTTRYTGTGGTTIPTAGTGLGFIAGNATTDYLVYDPSNASAGVQNLKGYYTTTGSNFTVLPGTTRSYIPNFPTVIPNQQYNLQPPNAVLRNKYDILTGYLEQQVGDNLYFQLAWNHNEYDRTYNGTTWTALREDVNQFLPNGSANPNVGRIYADGQVLAQRQWNPGEDIRFLGSYKLKLPWMTQDFSFLASENRGTFNLTNDELVRTNNGAVPVETASANVVYQRRYVGQAYDYRYGESELSSNGINVGMFRNQSQIVPTKTESGQIAAVGSYFHDMLTSIAGVRRDVLENNLYNGVLQPDNSLVYTAAPAWYRATTGSGGLVFYPVPWVGPYVNYSQSFAPAPLGNPLFDGTQPTITHGVDREYGLQLKLFNNRLQGHVNYYDSKESGRVIAAPAIANINDIYTLLGQNAKVLTLPPRDTQTLFAHGVEGDFTYSITENWRGMFNIAFPKDQQNDSLPGTKAYVKANLPAWQAATTDPTVAPATQMSIANDITAIQSGIQGANDGRANNGTVNYTANLYSAYTLSTGYFKGLGFGGGAQIVGAQIIGNVLNQPYTYIYGKEYYLATAMINYQSKIAGINYKLQLNVNNLFDNRNLVYTSAGRPGGVGFDVPNGFRFQDPRRFILTLSLDY